MTVAIVGCVIWWAASGLKARSIDFGAGLQLFHFRLCESWRDGSTLKRFYSHPERIPYGNVNPMASIS